MWLQLFLIPVNPGTTSLQPQKNGNKNKQEKNTRDITDSESCFFGLEGLGLGNNINLLRTKY